MARPARTTAAWPLTWTYALLVVYASLYPFEPWRVQGIAPWAFMAAPWPRYWTAFDLISNVLGYAPLGFLMAWSLQRTRPVTAAWWWATLASAGLSLLMESLQMFLPSRVPSNVDALLNVTGAALGAGLARALGHLGWMDRWSRWRARWFDADSAGALALLALWPLALMFPAAVPFGLGQVYERAEAVVALWLRDTPWASALPLREVELQPMLATSELVCIAAGLLLPVLLAYGVVRPPRQRFILAVSAWLVGLGASALSAALTWGPSHAWGWVQGQVLWALALAAVLALALVRLSSRLALVGALVLLVWQLSLLNTASANAYFAQTLQIWEQGRFIRFHGLIQWIGWLWPYGLLAYLVARLAASPRSGQRDPAT